MSKTSSGDKSWSDEAKRKGTCAVLRVRGEGSEAKRTEREAKRSAPPWQPEISGDNSLRDPPVPIPNTEVKPQHADSTWLETAR